VACQRGGTGTSTLAAASLAAPLSHTARIKSPMPYYAAFLGAPPLSELAAGAKYEWMIIPPELPCPPVEQRRVSLRTAAGYAPATLEAVSRRISALYQNVIFDVQYSGEGREEDITGGADDSEVQRGTW
jgi:hypothetical protein